MHEREEKRENALFPLTNQVRIREIRQRIIIQVIYQKICEKIHLEMQQLEIR
jgi:hypothetical protein